MIAQASLGWKYLIDVVWLKSESLTTYNETLRFGFKGRLRGRITVNAEVLFDGYFVLPCREHGKTVRKKLDLPDERFRLCGIWHCEALCHTCEERLILLRLRRAFQFAMYRAIQA